jgi:hypothetical protein
MNAPMPVRAETSVEYEHKMITKSHRDETSTKRVNIIGVMPTAFWLWELRVLPMFYAYRHCLGS